jgi:hypothetical protein
MGSFEQQDVSNRVTHNGFGLAESEEFEIQMLKPTILPHYCQTNDNYSNNFA